jgi:ABC-type uncharacterized transport system permease subunit
MRTLIRFSRALFATSVASAMAQRGAFLMQAGLMAVNNAIFFTFWIVLFSRVSRIRGYALGDVAVLYGIVAAGVGLAMTVGGGAPLLARAIHEGELDALLPQPKPALLYAVGRRTVASGIGDVASGIAMIALSGIVSAWRIPVVVVAILGRVGSSAKRRGPSSAFGVGQAETVGTPRSPSQRHETHRHSH